MRELVHGTRATASTHVGTTPPMIIVLQSKYTTCVEQIMKPRELHHADKEVMGATVNTRVAILHVDQDTPIQDQIHEHEKYTAHTSTMQNDV